MKYFDVLRFITHQQGIGYTLAMLSLKRGVIVVPTDKDATTLGQLIKKDSDLRVASAKDINTNRSRFRIYDTPHPIIPDNQFLYLAVQEADDMLSDLGMKIDTLMGDKIDLETKVESLTRERDDADRRAGAADRQLECYKDGKLRRSAWTDTWKEKLGYDRNVSFDVVMNDLVSKARPDVKIDGDVTYRAKPDFSPPIWDACVSYRKGDKIMFEGHEITVDTTGILSTKHLKNLKNLLDQQQGVIL
jgi:hypothetical protein